MTSVDETAAAATSSASGSGTSGTVVVDRFVLAPQRAYPDVTAQVVALDETNVDAAQAALD